MSTVQTRMCKNESDISQMCYVIHIIRAILFLKNFNHSLYTEVMFAIHVICLASLVGFFYLTHSTMPQHYCFDLRKSSFNYSIYAFTCYLTLLLHKKSILQHNPFSTNTTTPGLRIHIRIVHKASETKHPIEIITWSIDEQHNIHRIIRCLFDQIEAPLAVIMACPMFAQLGGTHALS